MQGLASVGSAIRAASMSAIVTLYVSPDRNTIDTLSDVQDGLVAKLLAPGFQTVEHDLERGWSASFLCGFRTNVETVAYRICHALDFPSTDVGGEMNAKTQVVF